MVSFLRSHLTFMKYLTFAIQLWKNPMRGKKVESVHFGAFRCSQQSVVWMSADCWVLCLFCFAHSLPLSLQSALHWEKHVVENCKCAELCECVYAVCVCVCVCVREAMQERRCRCTCSAPNTTVCMCCKYVCEYACLCVHAALLSGESRCLSPPLPGMM